MTNDPHIQSGRDTIQAGRDVIQVGGDYVGRDKVVQNYFGTPQPVETTPEQRAASLAAYRQRLLEDTHYISWREPAARVWRTCLPTVPMVARCCACPDEHRARRAL